MRASWYSKTGPAVEVIKIGEIETPNADEGEVRVKLHASGVNPADVKLRSGISSYDYNFPLIIPNSDGAGIVDQVGPNVSKAFFGKKVWVFNGQRLGRAFGTAAEFITLNAKYVTELPECASFEQGATFGIPGMTAYHSVFSDGPVLGKTILITGGAGAVGFYAVSLAAWGGARVLATVSNSVKGELAILGGATDIINYKEEDVTKSVKELTNGEGVDRVVSVDFGGNLSWLTNVIRQNGCVAAYASDSERMPKIDFYQFMKKNIQIRPFILNALTQNRLDNARYGINKWVSERPNATRPIAAEFELEKISDAHELVESGSKFGTVIVKL
jgi:NADPH2:quinone reductase